MAYLTAISSMAFIWFLVVTIPGPNFIVITQASMAQSRKIGFFIALGASTGAGTWATASLVGLSALFRYAAWMYEAVKVIGGCYMMYMGITTIWSGVKISNSLHKNEDSTCRNTLAAFRKGLLTSFSNPKTAAFFGSLFLSTFPAQTPLWFNAVAVLTVMAISITWYGLMAFCFSFEKVKIIYTAAKRILNVFTGSLLSYFGGRLILSRT